MKPLAVAGLVFAVALVTAAEPLGEWTYPVTYKGKPATGVKVGVIPADYSDPAAQKTGETVFATSDANGEVRFPKQAGFTMARLLARDADGRGGFGTIHGGGRYPATLELRENCELTGRVTDADGKPVAGLKLGPEALGPESFAQYGGRIVSFAGTPEWFWERFPVKLAADGSFVIPGVPVGHSVGVHFEAPGFGSGRFWVLPGVTKPVALKKAGAIRVKFAVPPDAKPGDVRVTATRSATTDWLEANADATAQAAAGVTLADLPPGEYQLSSPYRNSAFFPKSVPPVTVKPGETAEVTAALEPAARITAKLVDAKTGKGVAGAKLVAGITRGQGDYISVPEQVADAEGKVELLVPAGMVSVTPQAAEGYAVTKIGTNRFNELSTEPTPVAAGKSHDFGTFALVKTVELAGVVVDDGDKPVAGATVSVGYNQYAGGTGETTDERGRFVLKGLNPEGGVVGVTARKGEAITAAPVGVDPGKPEGELRLVVSPKFGARMRVRAVDRTGKPLAGVGVELMHTVMFLSRGGGITGMGTGGRVGATDADGRFATGVLQPGDRYAITLAGPGFRTTATAEWVAKMGETHDLGDVVLIRSDLGVTGTVVDLAGKHVAGATVFDNADGLRPTETKTDAAGRFTLGGLYEGSAFVSVRADGYRLASVAATPGGPAVAVTLRKLTDPPAPPPVISDAHKAATDKLARHVITAMWENRVAAGDPGETAIRAMAKLDPATAGRWRDEEKKRTDGKVDLTAEVEVARRDANLLKTAKDDPDEAVALLKPVAGTEGFRAVCSLASQLLADAPDKALRVAEEAVARARGLEEAERAWALAQAGELVYRAGKKDAGRKVIDEAAKLAEPLAFAELDGYRRGMVAARVALYDPAKCRAMIDPMKQAMEFNRWLAQACPRVAEHDLATAKKWFADFRPDNSFYKHNSRQWVAYRIVATKPDEAVEIARGIEDRTVRVCTLAGLATRLKDRETAAKLIESAIDGIVADPNSYYNGGGGGTAAILLFRAKQMSHPDLAGVRDKVLAARNPNDARHGPDFEHTFALALALTDPDTARPILHRALPATERANLDGQRQREALVALVLCDPAGATLAVDGMIARAVKEKKGYDYTGLDTLAALLSQPDKLAEAAMRSGRLLVDFDEE
jgi:hypothetical protein